VLPKASEHDLLKLLFYPSPPIFRETLEVTDRQGVLDKRSLDGVDETIDSMTNTAEILVGAR
jgi:hypothetical protein